MRAAGLKVGELARRAGVSVRTLHHYDAIGLLSPSQRSGAGYRLYGDGDVARLQQIRSLQQLGFSLEQVRACLAGGDFSPLRVVELHRERVRAQAEVLRRLDDRLGRLADALRRAEAVSADDFLHVLELTGMYENYYTPEQLEELRQRRESLGEEYVKGVEAEWPALMARVQAEMERGTDPADPRVQALARRWRELVEAFTGGNPGIAAAVKQLWQEQGDSLASRHSLPYSPELFDYVRRAQEAAGL